MQNTVYERKRNGADFILLLSVTTIRFGNRAANVLVTEQPQHSVSFCIFSTLQNTEIPLISNDLRFIFASLLLLALPITFHMSRHTYATEICLTNGVPIESLAKMLGHKNIRTTQIYAKITHEKLSRDADLLANRLNGIAEFKAASF